MKKTIHLLVAVYCLGGVSQGARSWAELTDNQLQSLDNSLDQAETLWHSGDRQAADLTMRRLLESHYGALSDEGRTEYDFYIGSFWLKLGRHHQAKFHLERALNACQALEADYASNVMMIEGNLIDAHIGLNEYAAANDRLHRYIFALRKLPGVQPELAEALLQQGIIHYKLADKDGAHLQAAASALEECCNVVELLSYSEERDFLETELLSLADAMSGP